MRELNGRCYSWIVNARRVSSLATSDLDCPVCEASMHLHQPDQKNPARLLAICDECQRWHLVELSSDDGDAMIITLPDAPKSGRQEPQPPCTG
jgi:hypothetical protein